MASTVGEQIELRESFLELISDDALRIAAFTSDEWVALGGTLLGYGQVASQDNPLPIKTFPGGLLGNAFRTKTPVINYQDPVKRAENIAAHLTKVKSHDYCKWLMSDTNFKNAWPKFQNKKDKKNSDDLLSFFVSKLKPINSEFADFRFLRLVTLHIGFQILADDAGYKPTYVESKTLVKAKGYINKLQATFVEGLALSNYLHHDQLKRHLEQLLLEIDHASRKENETPTFEKRKCLEAFALSFRHAFGFFVSATILTDLSAMLGWSSDHTTIDRIVKSTKTKHNQQLTKALKEHAA